MLSPHVDVTKYSETTDWIVRVAAIVMSRFGKELYRRKCSETSIHLFRSLYGSVRRRRGNKNPRRIFFLRIPYEFDAHTDVKSNVRIPTIKRLQWYTPTRSYNNIKTSSDKFYFVIISYHNTVRCSYFMHYTAILSFVYIIIYTEWSGSIYQYHNTSINHDTRVWIIIKKKKGFVKQPQIVIIL